MPMCEEGKKSAIADIKGSSGQIISARDWSHWIGLDKDMNHFRFLIVKVEIEFLKETQSSRRLMPKSIQ